VCVCVFLESVFELSARRSLAFGAGVERAEASVREISPPARICLIDSAAHSSEHTLTAKMLLKTPPFFDAAKIARKSTYWGLARQTTGINADCFSKAPKQKVELAKCAEKQT
jgi:hypothetical protein